MGYSSRGPGPPGSPTRPPIFLLVSLLVCFFGGALSENKQYHIQSLCKNHFLQQLYRKIDGAVLRSQNEKSLDCVITFQTHSILQRFMLRFDMLHLDCNDHLFIYDGAHAVGAFKADLNCRNTKQAVGAIFTRTNFVTLKYVTDGWGTDSNGFSLVITAVKDPKHSCQEFKCLQREFCIATDLVCDGINHCADGSDEAISSTCSKHSCQEFKCLQREFCIATDLVCDGINHCADGSDEAISSTCSKASGTTVMGMSMTLFVVIIVSCLLILCACVVALSVCICRRQAHPHQHAAQHNYNANMPLQQTQGSNGTGATATTIVSKIPGNWRHPAGLQLGYSGARVRLYCQAK